MDPTHRPRLVVPNRLQLVMRSSSLDAELDPNHVARSVWDFVTKVDLKLLYEKVLSVEGSAGRPAIDPALLVGLWLLATLEGVGSARELERLTREHIAYQWMCGGVSVGYHTLSDFRVEAGPFLDSLLATSITALVAGGVASLEELSIDGRRIRAHASAPSYRSRTALEELQKDAQDRVELLRKELESDPSASSRRSQAARKRAAEERLERVQAALARMPEAEAAKDANSRRCRNRGVNEHDDEPDGSASGGAPPASSPPSEPPSSDQQDLAPIQPSSPQSDASESSGGRTQKSASARVSVTDPEAKVMKMPDNGFRPAYNVQLATETKGSFVTGVYISSAGADAGLLRPVLATVENVHGRVVKRVILDGGFVNLDAVTELEGREQPVQVYMPPPRPRKPGVDRYSPKIGDSDQVAAWRTRMGTEAGRAVYARRGRNSEWVNAGLANRGCNQFTVIGPDRVRAIVLWQVVAHNFQREATLRRVAARSP